MDAAAVPSSLTPHLRRARDHMDRHFAESIDLEALAQVAGVSKYHFARSFAAVYGLTPIRYLTRRLERAQDLLRVANLTVTEICVAVGFFSLGSFSTGFRRLVGESPAAYRDRWAARGDPHVPGCYVGLRVDDCRKTVAELQGKGGCWLVLVEPRKYAAGALGPAATA